MIGRHAGEILTAPRNRADFILPPWLQLGGINLLFAPTGLGKSYVSMGIAWAAATGGNFLKFKAPRKFNVVYFDGEMGMDEITDRMHLFHNAESDPIEPHRFRVVSYEDSPHGLMWNLADHEDQKIYSEASEGAELVIIDNLITCSFPKNEHESDQNKFLKIIPWLIEMRRRRKTVILVHHTNKGGEDFLGTVYQSVIMSAIIKLRRTNFRPENPTATGVEWIYEKTRKMKPVEKERLYLEYYTHQGGYDVDVDQEHIRWECKPYRDAARKAVIEASAHNPSAKAIAHRTGISLEEVQAILDEPAPEKLTTETEDPTDDPWF